jgi:hypothetical protein
MLIVFEMLEIVFASLELIRIIVNLCLKGYDHFREWYNRVDAKPRGLFKLAD